MLKKYSSLLLIFARYQLLRDLQFKSSFIIRVLVNLAEFSFMLIFFSVIYGSGLVVPGWTLPETFILLSAYQLVNAIFSLFFAGVGNLSYLVEQGELDLLLTKPVDTQFFVSLRKINYESIFGLVLAVILLLSSAQKIALAFSPKKVVVFALLILSGVLLKYALGFLLMSFSLMLTRVDALYYIFLNFFTISQYPADIFGRLSKVVFSTIIPVIVVANIPAAVLLGGWNWRGIALSLGVATVFLTISRLTWLTLLGKYTSASS